MEEECLREEEEEEGYVQVEGVEHQVELKDWQQRTQ
jgi:hypothetical protein